MRRFRGLTILMAVAMLTLLFAGMAFASTTNTVSKVPSIDVDVDNDKTVEMGDLSITEPEDEPSAFEEGKSFTITLSDGVKLPADVSTMAVVTIENNSTWQSVTSAAYVTLKRTGDTTLDVKFNGSHSTIREKLTIKLSLLADDPEEGDVTAEIDDLGTSVTGGSYVVAKFVDSNCTVTVSDTDTISEDGGKLAKIKISENAANAIGSNNTIVGFKVTLPSDFNWLTSGDGADMYENDVYSFTGGLAGSTIINKYADGNDLYIAFRTPAAASNQRGAIEFYTYVDPDNSADMGEIEVTVDGERVDYKVGDVTNKSAEADIDSTDVVIGDFADYDVKVYADDEVEEIISGQEDQDLTTLKIDEGIAKSLLAGRKIQVDLPDYVRITGVEVKGASGIIDGSGTIDSDEDYSSWYVSTKAAITSSDSKDIEIDFTVSVAANAKAGDLVATVSGSAGAEGEVVIGKIVTAITVEADLKDIVLGDNNQVIGNIVIKENIKEAILDKTLKVELPEGVKWASTPDVEVTEGNLNVDDVSVETGTNTDDTLEIDIDSKSSKPSTITISGVKLTVDRTVPFGGIVTKFKGEALAENYSSVLDKGGSDADEDKAKKDGLFDTTTAAKVAIANLTTPAVDNSGTFFIGSTVYSQNGSMKVMDAAPYIKNERTYVPVRYLAYMLGVTEDNIKYDEATKTVTITKGSDEVQLVIGSTNIMVNGEAKTMDVAPEITNDRTMLPARFVAESLGYTVGWNPATQSVVLSK